MMPSQALPSRLFLGFTTSKSWFGSYERISGWFKYPKELRQVQIDYCDNRPLLSFDCNDHNEAAELWNFAVNEANHSREYALPLMTHQRFREFYVWNWCTRSR